MSTKTDKNDAAAQKARADRLNAAVAAETYAVVRIVRGPGGMVQAEWDGDEALPVRIDPSDEPVVGSLPWGLVPVDGAPKGTYARP